MDSRINTLVQEYTLLSDYKYNWEYVQTITNVVFKNEEWLKSILFKKMESHPNYHYEEGHRPMIKKFKFILTNAIFDQNSIFNVVHDYRQPHFNYTYIDLSSSDYTFLVEHLPANDDGSKDTCITVKFYNFKGVIMICDNDREKFTFEIKNAKSGTLRIDGEC